MMELAGTHKSTISMPIRFALAGVIVMSLLFDNGVYMFACLLTFIGILYVLWKDYMPGIAVFAFLMQWVQVVGFVIWMDVAGYDINFLSPHGGTATLMSCVGLFLMALVFAGRTRKMHPPSLAVLKQQAALFNSRKVLVMYLISTFFLGSLGLVFGEGFAQIMFTLAVVKWIFFLLYGYLCLIRRKNRLIMLAIVLFEFSSGLFSYFSSFKEVLLYSIILSLTFVRRITAKQLVYGTVIGLVLGFLMLTWTAIKSDYRQYLNQGSHQQTIVVSRSEAYDRIGDQISNLNWKKYQFALGLLLYRLQYILHLAVTMDRVPEVLPHEYGAVWWDNVSFVLMPRILFPNKPIYEATVKTNKYTGYKYSGFSKGASFSLGYFADSYIDFGFLGMFFPLIMVSLYVAFIYTLFFTFKNLNILLRYGIINVCLYEFSSFEADGLYLFGRLTLYCLVFWILSKYVFPRLQTWLYQ